jgi:hypothetical protein
MMICHGNHKAWQSRAHQPSTPATSTSQLQGHAGTCRDMQMQHSGGNSPGNHDAPHFGGTKPTKAQTKYTQVGLH